MSMQRVALVTGANRCIGYGIARRLAETGIHVLVSARNAVKAQNAVTNLLRNNLSLAPLVLDVSQPQSIDQAVRTIHNKFGRIDILVNKAGIFLKNDRESCNIEPAVIQETLLTNFIGPLILCQKVIPLMLQHNYGRIVNLSSGMGAMREMSGGYPGYRISKTALNAMTLNLASELRGSNILINSMCPGWVKTDMGGPNATRSVEKGAETAVWLSTLPDDGPSGKFFRDRKEISW